MSILQEFREFAIKGNMVDTAVGIIVGAAFGKVISSFVGDVVMPPLGMLIGGVDFSDLAVNLKVAAGNIPPVQIAYGKFIQSLVDFLIVAWAIFMAVKLMNTLRKRHHKEPPASTLTREQELLTEIRDLLKKKSE